MGNQDGKEKKKLPIRVYLQLDNLEDLDEYVEVLQHLISKKSFSKAKRHALMSSKFNYNGKQVNCDFVCLVSDPKEDTSHYFQYIFDGTSHEDFVRRGKSQMTLGLLIAVLSDLPKGTMVENLRNPHSYRGYYSDLAFERRTGMRSASSLLRECRTVMGKILEGYKGGDFVMGETTPVWISSYGECSGTKIVGLNGRTGLFVVEQDDV